MNGALGGTIVNMFTWGGSPMEQDAPPEWAGKIMHASLTIGETLVLGADVHPNDYEQPRGFSVLLGVDDPDETERIFHALAENGIVKMPIQQTFWAVRFGALVDQFGIP